MNKSIEILAPGGSFDAFKAAVDSGADAVYLGGNRFGARANAVNLTNEQIAEAVNYAHLRSAKVYVTVNTLVADSELKEVFDFLKFCYISGVDGVIVQDLGIINIIKTYFPDFRMHASTQMTIHNLAGAITAQRMGFDRVVLSRELSFAEIKYIAENCDIELEVFVHGALCMSYSGQCLFSSFLGGRSGNRGSCAQPCRLPYTLMDSNGSIVSEKDKYILSLKDLCLIDYISELKKIGVASLKIEGRMKSEAYVSAVCGIYNKYRDGGKVSKSDHMLLQNIFSRGGFTDGYYNPDYGRNMLCYDTNHDNIFDSATDDVLSKAMTYADVDRTVLLDANFWMRQGKKPRLAVTLDGKSFVAEGDSIIELASNVAATVERIYEQLSKLGGTVFKFKNLNIDMEDGLYIPIKEINNMRRSVISQIEQYICGMPREFNGPSFNVIKPQISRPLPMLTASVLTAEQASAAYDLGFERIYIPYDVYMTNPKLYDSEGTIFFVRLPAIIHDSKNIDISSVNTENICITNIGQLTHLQGKNVHADYRMNIFNSLAVKQLVRMGVKSCTLSPELTIAQMSSISASAALEIVVYGRISLMTVRNCLIKSSKGKCHCLPGEVYYLKDRKNISFPVVSDKSSCTNVIYNSAPIVMSDRMKELDKINASMHRFDFTVESSTEMQEIIKLYDKSRKPDGFFTRGHFYNGVQ